MSVPHLSHSARHSQISRQSRSLILRNVRARNRCNRFTIPICRNAKASREVLYSVGGPIELQITKGITHLLLSEVLRGDAPYLIV